LGICGVVSLLPVNLHDVALNQIEGVLYFWSYSNFNEINVCGLLEYTQIIAHTIQIRKCKLYLYE
jgi:hypothetical protein